MHQSHCRYKGRQTDYRFQFIAAIVRLDGATRASLLRPKTFRGNRKPLQPEFFGTLVATVRGFFGEEKMIMHRRLILLVVLPFLIACADQQATQPSDEPLFFTVKINDQDFRAAKMSATSQSDLSIELSYAVRGGRAYIDAVRIDGVEYRADCASAGASDSGVPGMPHYEDCADGKGIRDQDFTCDGYAERPPHLQAPTPEDVRLQVEGNEGYLSEHFETAQHLKTPTPETTRTVTYNLTNGKADFFRLVIKQQGRYIISSTGETDTWGDLYRQSEGESIKAIAGTGKWADHGNFALDLTLEPGTYFLRVSSETGEPAGTYRIRVMLY